MKYLDETIDQDRQDDTDDRSDTEMNGETERQSQHCHVQDNGAGQTEGLSVVEPGKSTVCSKITDKAAKNGSDQHKHDEHPCALRCNTFAHM